MEGWRDIDGTGLKFKLWTDHILPRDRRGAGLRGLWGRPEHSENIE